MTCHRTRISVSALALFLLLALGGCKSNQQTSNGNQPAAGNSPTGVVPGSSEAVTGAPTNGAPAQPPPPPPVAVDLPPGTRFRVRLDQDLGSKISQPGEFFTATVEDPVVINGTTVVPRGARADGTVVDAKPLGRFKGGAFLQLRLDRVHTTWGRYPVATSSIDRVEKGKGKRTAVFAGGGGAFGALIGGLAGGGRGAIIGAAAGAGAGSAGNAFTGNKQIVLPAETLLTFRLEHSVHIVEGQ